MAPLVISYAVSPQLDEVPFTLLGIDPFAEAPFRSYLGSIKSSRTEGITSLLTVPGSILLSAPTAERYRLKACAPEALTERCRLELAINGKMQHVYLTGVLEPSDDFARRLLDTLMLTDIATAQSLTGMGGRLSQIDLILPEDLSETELSETLPAGTLLVRSELRNSQVAEMTDAFQVNLTALSLLALLVGVFLIYNAMTFSVLQRRPVFGTLRSLGYTPEQVFGMVLGEAALIGALGAGLGLGLGVLLGQGAVQMVTQTINDLYFVVTVRGLQIPASSLLKGGLAGFFASLLAAAPPAWEAASVPPRLALLRTGLESKVQRAVEIAAGIGVLVTLSGAGILVIPTRDLVVSFSGTSAIVIGLAALTPFVTVALMRQCGKPLGRLFGLLGRLAPRNVIRSQSRTAVAVAALMLAVAVTIGVQVMISSFRTTVTLWLDQIMQGDVYISEEGSRSTRLDTALDPQVIELAQSHPMIESRATVRAVTVESEQGPVDLIASDTKRPLDPRLFLAVQGDPQQALQEGGILLSEPLANRLGISAPGRSLSLLTPAGWQSFQIAGIYADYGSTRGTVRMNLAVYRRLWDDQRVNGLVLFLAPGADPDAFTDDLRRKLSAFPTVHVNPSGVLREQALVVFDRTFAITAAMQLITTIVAFIGVLSSLLALQLEKKREMGILRALGLTVAEMRRLTFWETGLLGASAGVLALPTGYILAWILIFVINQRSFGWTLQMHAELLPFAEAFLLAVGAALLAALYPAWRIGRMQVTEALRGE
jgi:putative ABC transport system permease protein